MQLYFKLQELQLLIHTKNARSITEIDITFIDSFIKLWDSKLQVFKWIQFKISEQFQRWCVAITLKIKSSTENMLGHTLINWN